MIKKLIFVVVLVAISGCMATPYKPNGLFGGYSETPLAPTVYKIYFQGNGYTSTERAADFSLLRGANLALEHGYSYFVIADENTWQDSLTWVQRGSATTQINDSTTATTNYSPGLAVNITKPRKEMVVIFSEEKVNGAVDAKFVREKIMEKYGIKEDSATKAR